MNLVMNYPQGLYSKIQSFIWKKVLGVLGGIGNGTNKIINDVGQLITVEPNAACQKDFQIKQLNKIVPLISFIEDKVRFPTGLSLVYVSRREK